MRIAGLVTKAARASARAWRELDPGLPSSTEILFYALLVLQRCDLRLLALAANTVSAHHHHRLGLADGQTMLGRHELCALLLHHPLELLVPLVCLLLPHDIAIVRLGRLLESRLQPLSFREHCCVLCGSLLPLSCKAIMQRGRVLLVLLEGGAGQDELEPSSWAGSELSG